MRFITTICNVVLVWGLLGIHLVSSDVARAKEAVLAADGSPREIHDRVKAVPKKPVLKKHRVEITPMASLSLNDSYYQHYTASGSVIWYWHDAFGMGVGADYFFKQVPTYRLEEVRRNLTSVPALVAPPKMFVHVDGYWLPMYGKVSLFDRWIIPFDCYVSLGLGVVATDDNKKPMLVNAAVGQRFFFNDWLALRFEVRDYVYVDRLRVVNQTRSDVQNHLLFLAGLSVFLPTSFEYGRW